MSEGKPLRVGEFEVDISQQDMPSWITRLNAGGGKIISVKSSVSLETVFFRILDEQKQADDKSITNLMR
ncbi:MAG: hypothetical protein COB79_03015 [Zetaproteobacteria bacterium]|nr:MAG: hypothetical protein COB79_03015 [Zetaproteobacteria bacterium]